MFGMRLSDCRAIFARYAAGAASWDAAAFKRYAQADADEDPRDPCAKPDACGHAGDPGILFALFDADEDGALSPEEVCDMRSAGAGTPKPSATPTPAEPAIPGITWGPPKG